MVLVIIFNDVVLPGLRSLWQERGQHEGWHGDHEVDLRAGLQLYPVLRIAVHQANVEDRVPSHLAVWIFDRTHRGFSVWPRVLRIVDGAGVPVELAVMVEPEAFLVEVSAAELELLLVDRVGDSI